MIGLEYLTHALVREALGSVGTDGRVVPRLATGWEVSADGTEWTFRLPRGVTFHDGTPLTSHSLVPFLRERLTGLANVSNVTARSDEEILITLPRATPFLLEEVAFQSVGIGDGATIGTGPFRLAENTSGQIRFAAFEHYRRGTPEISQVTLTQYPNLRGAWSAMMRDEVDALYEVSSDAREFVEAESSVNIETFLRPYVYLLGLNHRRHPFNDPDVRRALNIAVNRDEAIAIGLRGFGRPAFDPLWPLHWAVAGTDPTFSFQPEQANALLDRRYPIKGGDGDGMPARFRFTCLVYQPFEKLGLALQRQFAEVGIDMALEVAPLEVLAPRAVTGDYDAFLFEMASARSLSFPYLFWHSSTPPGTVPATGYSAADEALDRVRYASTDADVRTAVAGLREVFRRDPPAVFIAWPFSARAVSRKFVVDTSRENEDVFHTIAAWHPADAARAGRQ